MPAKLSNDFAEEIRVLKSSAAPHGWAGRALMLGLNFIPLLHVALLLALAFVLTLTLSQKFIAILSALYLLPPFACRCLLALAPIRDSRIVPGSRQFFVWWASFQLQVLFCRFPALEEILRVIPSLYSQWLRLWGSRIGRLAYWSAGTLITDRSFLCVGDDVVLGAGVRLNAHVIARDAQGKRELLLAPITIGDRALVGGYSLLTAGSEISADEGTRAFLISPPFSVWKDGKRLRNSGEERCE